MVPVAVQAFQLLAVCVALLAAVLLMLILPRRAQVPGWLVAVALLAVVIVLAVIVLITTAR